jgi:hypothetical protein
MIILPMNEIENRIGEDGKRNQKAKKAQKEKNILFFEKSVRKGQTENENNQ